MLTASAPDMFAKNTRMNDTRINLSTITGRINATALALLDASPEGLRWTDLLSKIKASDPTLHPKTINGCVWKLVEKFPDKVHKPSKGLFQLLKYQSTHQVQAPHGSK